MQLLRLGDTGPAVAEVRARLSGLGFLHNDGPFGAAGMVFDAQLENAVRAFQQHRGLLSDGIVGPATRQALKEASYRLGTRTLSYHVANPLYGDDVAALQTRLQDLGFYTKIIDGFFGPEMHAAVSSYQREFGLVVDGVCGPATLRALDLLGTRVTGGSPHAILAEELVRTSGPQLGNKRIIIDPGLGAGEPGTVIDGPKGPVSEADILWDLATRLEGRMGATGMEIFLTRTKNTNPTAAERAATANSLDGDVFIALRCAHSTSPAAEGVATFHFGVPSGPSSMIGEVLARFIQKEVVARTGLLDCRTHGRSWELLRMTRMPAAQVDVGYLTNSADCARLADPRVRDTIAEAIVIAVKRLYLLGKNDQPTGTFTFADLLAHEQEMLRRKEEQQRR